MSFLQGLSDTFGWIYFLAWSISFYPQIILNYRRKSVTGLSFEYQAYNITGFTFYTVYSIVNYYEQHRLHLTTSVEPNDLAFAIHAWVMTCVVIYQCVTYKLQSQTINRIHLFVVATLWVLAIYNILLSSGGYLPWYSTNSGSYNYNTMEYLGYAKAFISFIKYTPQAYMNWKRQSTIGWSIGNVLLDFTGGSLSLAQQGITCTG